MTTASEAVGSAAAASRGGLWSAVLTGDLRSPAVARRLVLSALDGSGHEAVLDACLLLTSELVTNAVVHAGTGARLSVRIAADEVRVEVTDDNAGPLRRPAGASDELSESGRGIELIEALAERWGTEHTRAGKTVWFTCVDPFSGTTEDAAAPSVVPGQLPPPPLEEVPTPESPGLVGLLPPLLLREELADHLSLREELTEVVRRLLDVVGAVSVVLEIQDDRESAAEEPLEVPWRLARGAVREVSEPVGRDDAPLGWLRLTHDGPWGGRQEECLRAAAAVLALVLRRRRLAAARREQERRLSFLAEASELLSGSLDMDQTLALLARLAVPTLGTWAAAHAVHEEGEVRLTGLAALDDEELPALRARVAAAPVPLVAATTQERQESGHRLAVPLRARQRLLGMLLIGRDDKGFGPEEMALAEDLGRRAALAVDNARLFQQQVAVAVGLQQALLPAGLPRSRDVDFGAAYVGVREGLAVGGDFYDVIATGPDEWGVVIGDVCGKGAEAAALTGVARDVLRLLLREGRPLPAVLAALNGTILLQGDRGRFCTVAIARVRRAGDGGLDVTLCSAGHPEPVHLRASGEARLVPTRGSLLGVLPDEELDLREERLRLAPGESLVFYTDGVTERRDGGRMFGEFGLLAALSGAAGMSAPAIAAHLQKAAVEHTPGALRDDLAVLVVRCRPAGAGGARRS